MGISKAPEAWQKLIRDYNLGTYGDQDSLPESIVALNRQLGERSNRDAPMAVLYNRSRMHQCLQLVQWEPQYKVVKLLDLPDECNAGAMRKRGLAPRLPTLEDIASRYRIATSKKDAERAVEKMMEGDREAAVKSSMSRAEEAVAAAPALADHIRSLPTTPPLKTGWTPAQEAALAAGLPLPATILRDDDGAPAPAAPPERKLILPPSFPESAPDPEPAMELAPALSAESAPEPAPAEAVAEPESEPAPYSGPAALGAGMLDEVNEKLRARWETALQSLPAGWTMNKIASRCKSSPDAARRWMRQGIPARRKPAALAVLGELESLRETAGAEE